MKYQDIKEFSERCNEHPDHQDGMISNSMIQQRLHEEIDELRKYLEREWVGLTDEEIHGTQGYQETREMYRFAKAVEAKLKEKNHG